MIRCRGRRLDPAGLHSAATRPEWGAPGTRMLHLRTPTFIRRGGDSRGSLESFGIVEDLVQFLSQAYGAGLSTSATKSWR
jgi:hypothetical protein